MGVVLITHTELQLLMEFFLYWEIWKGILMMGKRHRKVHGSQKSGDE